MNWKAIWLSVLPFFFGIGCDESTANVDARCEIEVVQVEGSWTLGDSITLQGYPLSSIVDTTVLLNDTDVDILNIDTNTDACTECRSCREAEFCTTCGFCEACDIFCTDCLHELEFTIPEDLPDASEFFVTIVNGFGSSSPTAIEIVTVGTND